MKRSALVAVLLLGCGHGKAGPDESIAVVPKPVVAKPIEVVGENAAAGGDVAPFELAIGSTEFCVRIAGKVHCGTGDDAQPLAASAPIGGIQDATSLSLGQDFGCLATRRGTVHCWGSNSTAQLGAKIAEERSNDPVQVSGLTNAQRVFAGDEHACATTSEGGVVCWGLNSSGETGGTTSWAPLARELATPNAVLVRDVTSVTITHRTTCASTKTGTVYCWGGSIVTEQQQTQGYVNEQPYPIKSLADMEQLSAGAGAFCGVRRGDVHCVGSTYALVANDNDAERDRDAPAKIPLKNVAKIGVGGSHACVATREGRVLCWGYDSNGELGRNEAYDPNTGYQARSPAAVPGIVGARDIVVSRATSCAITGPEEVWCWGMWPYPAAGGHPRQERSPVRLRIR